MTLRRALRLACGLALAGLVSGPRPALAYDTAAFIAPEGQARVVFIQTLRVDESLKFTVFGPDKLCMLEVGGREAAVVSMKPGRHTLYVASYNNHRLELDLEAGRTYFIRLFSIEKFAMRVSEALAVQRGTDAYKSLRTWLKGARVRRADDDPCRGKAPDRRANRTQRRLNEANADWKHEDDAFRSRHVLIRSDGLTATEVQRL